MLDARIPFARGEEMGRKRRKVSADSPLVLVDGNNVLCMRRGSSKGMGRHNGLVKFLNEMIKLARNHVRHRIVVVFDGGHSNRRHALCPGYKGGRSTSIKDKVELKEDIVILEDILPKMGIHAFSFRGVEADDVIACLARGRTESVILSTDKDFNQLIGSGCSIIQKHKFVDEQSFKAEKGLEPLEHRLLLALMGDSGDSVPGVKGIGKAKAHQIIERIREAGTDQVKDGLYSPLVEYDGLDEWAREQAKETGNKTFAILARSVDQLRVQMQLVDLWDPALLPDELVDFCEEALKTVLDFDYEGVKSAIKYHGIHGVSAEEADRWLRS